MVVAPVAIGSGKANLGPAFAKVEWQPLEQKLFSSGALMLRYEKA